MCEELKNKWENLDKRCRWCLILSGGLGGLFVVVVAIVLIVLGVTGNLAPK